MCGTRKEKWIYPAIWADRVTTRKSTGYSPYYLLYGKPHLFPYNIHDETWYTIDWHGIDSMEELLAVRALQIGKMQTDCRSASKRNMESQINAARDYTIKNARRLISGIYGQNELVIVALKGPGVIRGQGLAKSEDIWAGPFKISKRHRSGSYQLKELDRSILKGSIAAQHLKPFYMWRKIKYGKWDPGSESSEGEGQFEVESGGEMEQEDEFNPED